MSSHLRSGQVRCVLRAVMGYRVRPVALVQTRFAVSDDGQLPPVVRGEQLFKGRHFEDYDIFQQF